MLKWYIDIFTNIYDKNQPSMYMGKSTSIYTNTMDPLGSPRHHGIPPQGRWQCAHLGPKGGVSSSSWHVMRPFWLIILQQLCTESGSLVRELGKSPQNALNSGLGIIVVYPERMINDQVDQVD